MPDLIDRTVELKHIPELTQLGSQIFGEMVTQTKDLINSYWSDYYHDANYLSTILEDTVNANSNSVTFYHGASYAGSGTLMSRAPNIIDKYASVVYRYTLDRDEHGYWSLTLTKVK